MVFGNIRKSGMNFSKVLSVRYFHAFETTLGEDLWSLKLAIIMTDFVFLARKSQLFCKCRSALLLCTTVLLT